MIRRPTRAQPEPINLPPAPTFLPCPPKTLTPPPPPNPSHQQQPPPPPSAGEMALYLLFESASGYGLFHAYGIDEIGQSVEAVRSSVLDLERFGKAVKLTAFNPFSSAVDALNQCNAISEGPLPPTS